MEYGVSYRGCTRVHLAGAGSSFIQAEGYEATGCNDHLPLKTLLRSRFLWQFTLSKVFSDPAWYFYIFWVPQYLKVVHGFSMQRIGETAWIPFLPPPSATLPEGRIHGAAADRPNSGHHTPRRHLIFSVLMTSALLVSESRSAAGCIALISVATFGYTAHLRTCSPFPEMYFPRSGGLHLGLRQHRRWFRRHDLQPGDWLAGRAIFLSAGVRTLRNHSMISAWLVWTLPATEELAPAF